MRRSIYVKDEDVELFEWAEEVGDSVSATISHALRMLRDTGIKSIPKPEGDKTTKEILNRMADCLDEIRNELINFRDEQKDKR